MSIDAQRKRPKYGSWQPCEVEGCDGEREIMAVDSAKRKIVAPCETCLKTRKAVGQSVPTKED